MVYCQNLQAGGCPKPACVNPQLTLSHPKFPSPQIASPHIYRLYQHRWMSMLYNLRTALHLA